MKTIRALLRTTKGNSKGLYPVSVCVTDGKRTYHSTGISIAETAWDKKKGRVKANMANAASYNAKIAGIIADLENGEHKSKGAAISFFEYAESVFKDMEAKGQDTTAKRYRHNIPSLQAYGGANLLLSQMDRDWLKGYEQYCRGKYKNPRVKAEKAIAQNTIWSRFKMLRKVLLMAAKDGHHVACQIGEKRGGYPMPKWESVPKDYLTLPEVDSLFNLLGSAGLTEREDTILAFYLVECTSGIRHSDWSRFKVERLTDTDALKVRTKKTGEPVYVPILPDTRLAKIIAYIKDKDYTYHDTETAGANRTLKIIAKMAGISKRITTHTGRHTAGTLYLELGFSREAVGDILGISIQVVDTYAKMTRQKVRNEFAKYGGL